MHRKWLLLLIPAIVVLGGYLYLRFSLQSAIRKEERRTGTALPLKDTLEGKKVSSADLRPLFIKRLQQLLSHSSHNLYRLTVGDMKVDLLASTVSLQDVVMRPDAEALAQLRSSGGAPQNVFTLRFKKLVIDGINLDDALTRKTMDYKLVKVVNPVIEVERNTSKDKEPESQEDVSQRFLREMQKLDIKRLVVEGGTIITYKKGRKANRLEDVQVRMSDILLNEETRRDRNRFLFAKEATLSFRNYRTQTKDGMYALKAGKVTVRAPQQQVVLQNLSFGSPLSRAQFVARHKFSQELYRLALSRVTLNGVDWWTLLNGEEIIAGDVVANGGKLSVYFDRGRPLKSRMGKFPNQLLMKLPVKLNVAHLRVRNLDLSYEEHNPISQQSGTVYMDRVRMDITNLSNVNGKPVVVNGTALFMHRAPIQAHFSFDMNHYREGEFSATVNSSAQFGGDLINSFSMPLGLVKIEDGTLQKLQASIRGNQWQASGNVLVLYNDLKLDLMEKDQGKTALDKKDVTSFLANTFVLKKDNPKEGRAPRRESASFTRIPEGGFFLLVWKTILAGALKTIGAPVKIASKTANAATTN